MFEKRVSQTIRPIDGPMNLNDGKPSAKDLLFYASLSLLFIILMSLGGAWLVWATPKHWYDLTWYTPIGMFAGILIVIFFFRYAWHTQSLMLYAWRAYHDRVFVWNETQLDTFKAQQGLETITEVSQLEITPQVCKDVLLTALAIQYRLQTTDQRYQHVPWSVRGLQEKLYLDGNNHSILLGEINGSKPEQMSATLAELGLIKDRKPGASGEWQAQSLEDVFSIIAKNWHKRRG